MTAPLRSGPGASELQARVLPFLLGVCAFVFVDVGGRVSIAETTIAAGFVFALWPIHRSLGRAARVLPATAVLIVGVGLADLTRLAPVSEWVVTASNYGLLAIVTVTVVALIKRTDGDCVRSLLVGLAIGQFIGLIVSPNESSVVDPWKFGAGWAVSVLALLVADAMFARAGLRLLSVLLCVAIGALNFALGSRSLGAIVLFASIALAVGLLRSDPGRRRYRTLILLIATLAVVAFLYDAAAQSGLLGAAAEDKYLAQSGNYSVAIGARKELVLLLASWSASPILGWGSVADVPLTLRLEVLSWFTSNGYAVSYADVQRLAYAPEVPLHSVVLGAFVQAGLLAVPFVIVFGMTAFAAIRVGFASRRAATTFVAIFAMAHILTSPLGDTTRIVIAVGCALAFAPVRSRSVESPPDRRPSALSGGAVG